MIYIIDANNFAGELGLLDKEKFDQEVICLIKKWTKRKKNKIILVFDSNDPMGDKYEEDNILVIYSPRDNYYKDADDKIIEVVEGKLKNKEKEEITFVSSDIELRERVKKIFDKFNKNVKIEKASSFSKKILKKQEEKKKKNKDELSQKTGFSDYEINEINKEILKKWSQ